VIRRSRLEIYFDVLEVIEKGTEKPTRIMYSTNLSWNTLNEILYVLISNGFITVEEAEGSKRYCLTEKGTRALSYHKRSLEGLVKPDSILQRSGNKR